MPSEHLPHHSAIYPLPRYNAVNPARLYALFVRMHTFLQQIDSLCNATAKTGDLLDFYNILHNQRCLSDTESERRKQCRTDNITFYSFYILIRQMSINQQFVIRGGGFLRKFFILFCLADEFIIVLLHVRLSAFLRRERTAQRLQNSPVCVVYQ